MTSFRHVVLNRLEPRTDDEGDMKFLDLLRVLRRRIRLIATIALVGTVAAALVGLELPPRYTAKTLLAIDSPELRVHDFPDAIERLPNQVSTLEMHIKLLASISHLKDVIADLGLFSDPEFQPRGLAATINHLLGGALAALGYSSDDNQGEQEGDLLDLIHDKFRIEQEGRSNLIAINFTSLSPDKAALIANRSAELYIVDRLNYNRTVAVKSASSFGERLSILKAEAERSDVEVEEYRNAHNIAGEGQTDISDRAVSDINKELSDAEAELIGLQARIAFIRKTRELGLPLDTIPEVVASPLMVEFLKQELALLREEAELSTSLGDKHPRMQLLIAERKKLQERISRETDRIISNIESRTKIAKTRVKSLEESLAKARQASDLVQAAQGPLSQMKRDAAATLQVYGHFLERYKQLKEQESLVQPDVQIVNYATPPDDPSSPSWLMFALVGFTTSTIFGSMLAVAAERVDRGIRSASDVYNVLGLIRIGLVPRLHGLSGHNRPSSIRRSRTRTRHSPLSAMARTISACRPEKSVSPSASQASAKLVHSLSAVGVQARNTLRRHENVRVRASASATGSADGNARRSALDWLSQPAFAGGLALLRVDRARVGSLPAVGRGEAQLHQHRDKPHQYLLKKPFSAYAEAMRSILAALRLSAVSPQPKVLLVTSSVPDEGKTTLCISLALSAELTGQRAILVDMDFRRPSIARDLGIEPAERRRRRLPDGRSMSGRVHPAHRGHQRRLYARSSLRS